MNIQNHTQELLRVPCHVPHITEHGDTYSVTSKVSQNSLKGKFGFRLLMALSPESHFFFFTTHSRRPFFTFREWQQEYGVPETSLVILLSQRGLSHQIFKSEICFHKQGVIFLGPLASQNPQIAFRSVHSGISRQ